MKRTFWAMIGAGFGFGMSFWTMRAVRRVAERWLPAPVLERVRRSLDALDGGSGVQGQRRTRGDAAPEPARLRSGGTPHPSTGSLRALAGGLAAGRHSFGSDR